MAVRLEALEISGKKNMEEMQRMGQSVARNVVQATALQDIAANPEVVVSEQSTFATVVAGGRGIRGRPAGLLGPDKEQDRGRGINVQYPIRDKGTEAIASGRSQPVRGGRGGRRIGCPGIGGQLILASSKICRDL